MWVCVRVYVSFLFKILIVSAKRTSSFREKSIVDTLVYNQHNSFNDWQSEHKKRTIE